jgi:hypothetical protein
MLNRPATKKLLVGHRSWWALAAKEPFRGINPGNGIQSIEVMGEAFNQKGLTTGWN